MARPVLFVLLAAALFGFTGDDTYLLKQKPVKGDFATMAMTMSISVGEIEVILEGKSSAKVLTVNEDGSYEQEETNLGAKQTINGEVTEVEKTDPKMVKYDKDGKRIKEASEEEPETDQTLENLSKVFDYTPDHAVKVGESWTHDSDFGVCKSTLEGKEKVGEVECLKITFKGSLNKKESTGEGEGSVYLRASDFQIVKAEMKLENLAFNGGPALKKLNLKLELVAD